MENWRFVLFFAAAFISITPAHWNNDNRFLPQPNVANMPQPYDANIPQPNFPNMPQPNFPNMPQPNVAYMPQPNAANMPQPYDANMPQPYDANNSGPVEINSCEFYSKDNAKDHHTEKYELLDEKDPPAILRRGQPFKMAIGFSRPFSIDSDSVTVELTFGSKRMKKRGPPVFLPVTSKKKFTHKPSNWDISLSSGSNSSKDLTLQIQIPYTAGVGAWRMRIIPKKSSGNQPKIHDCNKDVYILFNPWSKGDLIYMEDDIGRKEYVLNDVGDLHVGLYNDYSPKPWNFAQFHKTVLPAVIFAMEKAYDLESPYIDFASSGDPIKVVSTISAMVNDNDDDGGVLEGNWDGYYPYGTHPMEWTGSEPILRKYMESGGKTVRYGQCAQFSALSTTFCRTLGLPCRSVTNFGSGTDMDDDLVIKKYTSDGNIPTPKSEGQWNYHMWNECWMIRPDLKAEFNGWQAFDATPLASDETKLFRKGPASVKAISQGEINTKSDSKTFFGEANSDKHYIKVLENEREVLLRIDTKSVGKLLVTKKPLKRREEDITLTYKPKEGTNEERKVYYYARKKVGLSRSFLSYPKKEKGDVCFKFRAIPKIMIGKKFKMFIDVENKSSQKRTITFALAVNSVYYTGVIAKNVKSDRRRFILQPSQKKAISLQVGPKVYLEKMVERLMLRIYAQANVLETNQTWAGEDNFRFARPPLQIEYSDKTIRPKLFQPLKMSFSFTNPLKVALEDCGIIIEGLGLVEFSKTKLGKLGPGEALTHVETVTPKKAGRHRIVAIFTSRLMVAVLGSKQVYVEE